MVVSHRRPVAAYLLLDRGECALQAEIVAWVGANERGVYDVSYAVTGFWLREDVAKGGEEVGVVVDDARDKAEGVVDIIWWEGALCRLAGACCEVSDAGS